MSVMCPSSEWINDDDGRAINLFSLQACSRIDPENRSDEQGENTLTQMAEKMGSLPLMFHPAEQWVYGPSVDVQAFLVERLSGQPFDQYLMENIFGPLGMKSTGMRKISFRSAPTVT